MPKRCLFTIESITPAPAWYALSTRMRYEHAICDDLACRDIETFAPEVSERRTWSDRQQVIQVPLFPAYMFARFTDSNETRVTVLRARGVLKILGGAGEIYPVPDEQISAIRALIASSIPCAAYPLLHVGEAVRVTRGPLKDIEGKLVEIRKQTRLAVLVPILGRMVTTEIDICDVEPATARVAMTGRTAADAPAAGWRG